MLVSVHGELYITTVHKINSQFCVQLFMFSHDGSFATLLYAPLAHL